MKPLPAFLGLMVAVVLGATHALARDTLSRQSAPIVVRGQSGGPHSSPCGLISQNPIRSILLPQPLDFLRVQVQGGTTATLYIDGPGGNDFCVQADEFSKGRMDVSGYWPKGVYNIYVGDRTRNRQPFTLNISPKE